MSVPTVFPVSPFHPQEDASALRKAMKGFGTDEAVIINILANRSFQQREEILFVYNKDRNLIKDLKSDLAGKFEDIVLALMTRPAEFLAMELHRAMTKGGGTNENVIIEILCTRDTKSIIEIKKSYEKLYSKELSKDLKEETSDDFETLLVSLCSSDREESPAKTDLAPELVTKLYRAGEGRKGTDEGELRKILTTYSFATLLLVFDIYEKENGVSFGEVIQKELHEGKFQKAMRALYTSITNPSQFFAEALHKSMVGLGTRNQDLIRLVVSRIEIDMDNIKKEYHKMYNKTLAQDIKSDTSGDFEKMLVALIKG